MTRKMMLCTAMFGLMSTSAIAAPAPGADGAREPAAPKLMSDARMDGIVGGVDVVTPSGQLVWTVTSLAPPEGYNRGGNGITARASGGLLTAVANGGLMVAE